MGAGVGRRRLAWLAVRLAFQALGLEERRLWAGEACGLRPVRCRLLLAGTALSGKRLVAWAVPAASGSVLSARARGFGGLLLPWPGEVRVGGLGGLAGHCGLRRGSSLWPLDPPPLWTVAHGSSYWRRWPVVGSVWPRFFPLPSGGWALGAQCLRGVGKCCTALPTTLLFPLSFVFKEFLFLLACFPSLGSGVVCTAQDA